MVIKPIIVKTASLCLVHTYKAFDTIGRKYRAQGNISN